MNNVYFVLRRVDIAASLSDEERSLLERLGEKVEAYRRSEGADPLQCAVVEASWPEYPDVFAAMVARSEGAIAYVTPEVAGRAAEQLTRRISLPRP